MTKPNRTVMRKFLVAAPFLATATLLASWPALAQPGGYPDPFAPPQNPTLAEKRKPQIFEPEGPVTSWEPLRFAIAFEDRTTWLFDSGAKRIAGSRTSSSPGLSLQADVLRPTAQLALRLDLGWLTTSSSSFQSASSGWGGALKEQVDTDLLTLGASLRFHLFRWLAPYARLSGGMGWEKLTVASMSDRELFWHGSAGAGVFLRSPAIRLWQGAYSPWLGLVGSIEAGYTLATGSDFSLGASPPSSSADPIPANSVTIGHVGRTAPYLRANLGLAF